MQTKRSGSLKEQEKFTLRLNTLECVLSPTPGERKMRCQIFTPEATEPRVVDDVYSVEGEIAVLQGGHDDTIWIKSIPIGSKCEVEILEREKGKDFPLGKEIRIKCKSKPESEVA
jgi:hypothetical protein